MKILPCALLWKDHNFGCNVSVEKRVMTLPEDSYHEWSLIEVIFDEIYGNNG